MLFTLLLRNFIETLHYAYRVLPLYTQCDSDKVTKDKASWFGYSKHFAFLFNSVLF